VKENWVSYDPNLGSSAYEQFAYSLEKVKEEVALWSRERYKHRDRLFQELENEIKELFNGD
jgi:hypothetical protein